MNFLAQFWHAVAKVFDLPRRLRGLTDHRQDPRIPPPILWTTLLRGAVLRVPSFLQLQKETTVDAWSTKAPFLLAVQKLGWGVVTVLKQERFEVCQESEALRGEHPPQRWSWEDRSVAGWEVNDLTFTQARGPVRVVVAEEDWAEVKRVGGRPQVQVKHAAWRWLATEELAGYSLQPIWRIGQPGSPNPMAHRTTLDRSGRRHPRRRAQML